MDKFICGWKRDRVEVRRVRGGISAVDGKAEKEKEGNERGREKYKKEVRKKMSYEPKRFYLTRGNLKS